MVTATAACYYCYDDDGHYHYYYDDCATDERIASRRLVFKWLLKSALIKYT